jgi:hypothetical protein
MADKVGHSATAVSSDLVRGLSASGKLDNINGKTLWIFSDQSRIRRAARFITEHRVFNMVILALTIASCVLIAMSNPYDPPSDSWTPNDIINVIVVCAFGLECLLRIIGLGLILGPQTYLRDPLYVIDMIVFLTGVAGLIPGLPSARYVFSHARYR